MKIVILTVHLKYHYEIQLPSVHLRFMPKMKYFSYKAKIECYQLARGILSQILNRCYKFNDSYFAHKSANSQLHSYCLGLLPFSFLFF